MNKEIQFMPITYERKLTQCLDIYKPVANRYNDDEEWLQHKMAKKEDLEEAKAEIHVKSKEIVDKYKKKIEKLQNNATKNFPQTLEYFLKEFERRVNAPS